MAPSLMALPDEIKLRIVQSIGIDVHNTLAALRRVHHGLETPSPKQGSGSSYYLRRKTQRLTVDKQLTLFATLAFKSCPGTLSPARLAHLLEVSAAHKLTRESACHVELGTDREDIAKIDPATYSSHCIYCRQFMLDWD
ncbi:MAG: hypothetical protein Q9181_003926 [Wetmoreana brouardii]